MCEKLEVALAKIEVYSSSWEDVVAEDGFNGFFGEWGDVPC